MVGVLHQPIGDGMWRPEDIESDEPIEYEIVDGNLVLIVPPMAGFLATGGS